MYVVLCKRVTFTIRMGIEMEHIVQLIRGGPRGRWIFVSHERHY